MKHPMVQGAELVVGYSEVFQSGHLVEAARAQPGQMVVAKVKGDREGGQGTRWLGQTTSATAHCVRDTKAHRRAGLLRAWQETEQHQDRNWIQFTGHVSGCLILQGF